MTATLRERVKVLPGRYLATGERLYLFDLVTFDEHGETRFVVADRRTLKAAIAEAVEMNAEGCVVDWSAVALV